MTRSRKNTFWVLLALVLGFFALPFGSSEAHEADGNLTASECERLGSLSLDQMDGSLLAFAKECDMVEATHDWEQQYGNLNEEEMLAGVVYE